MIVGADVAALRRLATSVEQRGVTLRDAVAAIDQACAQTSWNGPDAEVFRDQWESTLRAWLIAAAESLDATGGTLRTNADQQEAASANDGAGVAPSAAAFGSSGASASASAVAFFGAPADPNEADYLGKEMQALRDSIPSDASPSEVRAWWNGLSAKERQALLLAWPVDLYELDGIPKSVKKDLEGDGPYNRMELVDYAVEHWDDESVDIFDRNCANYVSHALEAAGLGPRGLWGYTGNEPWYQKGRSLFGRDEWAPDTNVTDSWSIASAQHDMWMDTGASKVKAVNAKPGDLLYFMDGPGGDAYHATVVRAVGPDGTIYIAAHENQTRTTAVDPEREDFEVIRPQRAPSWTVEHNYLNR